MPQFASGQKLFNWIVTTYRPHEQELSWIEKLSHDFNMEDIETLLFRSTCLMIMRRFISNAEWYLERYPGEKSAVIEIFERDYLLGTFGFNPGIRRELRKLIFDSVEASKSNISERLRQEIFDTASIKKQHCKLCGKQIDYLLPSTDELSFSLDHIWPRSLGGESEIWNLQAAHKRCNEKRKDIADVSDVHYEHFNIKSIRADIETDNFWKEFNWQYRIAANMKAEFRCEVCRDPLPIDSMNGEWSYSLRNRDENYNIFNVQVTCAKHKRIS